MIMNFVSKQHWQKYQFQKRDDKTCEENFVSRERYLWREGQMWEGWESLPGAHWPGGCTCNISICILQHLYLCLATFVSCEICHLATMALWMLSVIWFLYKIAKAKYQEIQMFSGILLGWSIIISVWWELSHFSVFPGQHIFLS